MANQRRGPKRRTHWTAFGFSAFTVTATGSTLLATATGTHIPETLVRVRGYFEALILSATSVGDGFFGAIGMGVATSAAITAGIGSLPTPITEEDWDGWMLHRYFGCRGGIVGDSGDSGWEALQLDSKAMRKIAEDESLYWAVEVIETGTATMQLVGSARVLSMS